MNPSFQQTLVDVWRQVLIENADVVKLGGKRYSVRITPRKGLRQVDFVFGGNEIRGLEQNPDTKSRWAQLARDAIFEEWHPRTTQAEVSILMKSITLFYHVGEAWRQCFIRWEVSVAAPD